MARIFNALTEAVNDKKATLPNYLIVIIDKDIIEDIEDVHACDATSILAETTDWVVHQISMVVHHKWVDLLEKKPGSLSGLSTSIIFTRMLCRVGSYHPDSCLAATLALKNRFNDVLNDATAKINQYILTINSCNAYEHYNKHGMLSLHGKSAFWFELDDLLERFDSIRVKLLPNQTTN